MKALWALSWASSTLVGVHEMIDGEEVVVKGKGARWQVPKRSVCQDNKVFLLSSHREGPRAPAVVVFVVHTLLSLSDADAAARQLPRDVQKVGGW